MLWLASTSALAGATRSSAAEWTSAASCACSDGTGKLTRGSATRSGVGNCGSIGSTCTACGLAA